MMFCTACGAKVKDTFNYCSSCGTKIGDLRKKTEYQKRNNAANEGTSQDHVSNVGAKRQPLPTFAQYTEAKSVERQSHFKPTKRSKPNIHEVTLNVGLMEYVGSELKPTRGGSLPLKIPDSANYNDLLSAALKKREAFDKRFRAERGCVLAYPDTSLATKIPGTTDEFVLKKYKEWLGKPYSRITIYLSPVANDDELDDDITSNNTDDDNDADDISFNANDDIGDGSFKSVEEVLSPNDVPVISPYLATDFM